MVDRYANRNPFRAVNNNGMGFGIGNNCSGGCDGTHESTHNNSKNNGMGFGIGNNCNGGCDSTHESTRNNSKNNGMGFGIGNNCNGGCDGTHGSACNNSKNNGMGFGIGNNCNGGCDGTHRSNCSNSKNNRCSSCSDDNSECKKLLKQLQKLDFAMIETILYLDAYPDCKEALCHYHMLKQERDTVAEALSKSCNMPVTAFENASTTEWNWTDAPWPWEHDAN